MTNLTSSTSSTSSSSSSSLSLSSNSCWSLRGGVMGQRKRERDEGKDEGKKGQRSLRTKTLPPSQHRCRNPPLLHIRATCYYTYYHRLLLIESSTQANGHHAATTVPFLLLFFSLFQFFQVLLGEFDDVRGFLLGGQRSGGEGGRASVERLPVGGASQVFPQVLVGRLAFQQLGSAGAEEQRGLVIPGRFPGFTLSTAELLT